MATELAGMLVLVVGPSGVGKDTLIAYCRSRLTGFDNIVFPRRTITRDVDGTEDHEPVSEREFQRRVAAGAFAIHWQAHDLFYGVPTSIDIDIAAGRTVVVNTSRSVIEEARQRYGRLVVASVTARREVVAERLHQRGRETIEDIGRRLERARAIEVVGSDVYEFDNSGPIATAGDALLSLLVDGPQRKDA